MDAGGSKESNELEKNIPLLLNCLRKIQICAFAVLIFWQFSEKIKNSFPASRQAFSIRFMRFGDV